MRFDKLYDLVVEDEERLLEESFVKKLGLLAIAAILGLGKTNTTLPEIYNYVRSLKFTHPETYDNIKNQADQRIQDLINNRPEEIAEIESQRSTPKALDSVKKAIGIPVAKEILQKAVPVNVAKKVSDQKKGVDILKKATEIPKTKQEPKKEIGPEDKQKALNFFNIATRYITNNEIRNNKIDTTSYYDSNGHLTVGIGYCVRKGDIGTLFKEKDGEVSYVKNKKGKTRPVIHITKEKAIAIFQRELKEKINTANRIYDKFDKFPVALKVAILDCLYRGDLYRSTRSLIKDAMNHYFKGEKETAKKLLNQAATEHLKNKERERSEKEGTGVHKRMKRDAAFIKHALDDNYAPDFTSPTY